MLGRHGPSYSRRRLNSQNVWARPSPSASLLQRCSGGIRHGGADAVQHAGTRSHVRDVRGGEPVRVVTRHGDKYKAATPLR